MVGTASGEAHGNVFHWSLTLALSPGNPLANVRMSQWMYLQPDGRTLLNHSTIRKFGVVVAQVTEQFRREAEARCAGLVVLDKAEGAGFLRAAPRLGEVVPLHATAAGKLAFAFAPERFPLDEAGAEAFTERTLVDPEALRVEVERARKQGFAENHGEWIDGLSVVAAPVLLDVAGSGRRLIAVLAVAAATPRLRELGPARVARRAVDAARRVQVRLGAPTTSTRKTRKAS
jgi:hypothetical protein